MNYYSAVMNYLVCKCFAKGAVAVFICDVTTSKSNLEGKQIQKQILPNET